jgi:cysteine desulfurase/selenocysteine lyase
VFTSGATEAINLIASTYGRAHIEKGDEIIISEIEHHSNIVPWQMLVEEKGAVLKYIPIDKKHGCYDLQKLPELLTDKTKIVSLQHVSNVLACIHHIDEIVALTRSLASPNVKIVLDGCQSVPHMPVDVQALGVDFIAASGHKMCGPTGIGFLWGKEDILNDMPPYKGGGEMIDEVYMDHSTYAKAPARFEAGTPAIAQAIGLGAAIEYINKIGMDRIYNYEKELAHYLTKRMSEVKGVTVLGPPVGINRAAIVAFVCDNVHPSDLSTFLDMEGVAIRAGHHCCQPLHRALGYSHSARASLYFYNTKEEVDCFIDILKDTLTLLGGGDGENGEQVDDDFVPFV